jgi:hypothetical protein
VQARQPRQANWEHEEILAFVQPQQANWEHEEILALVQESKTQRIDGKSRQLAQFK